MKLAYLSNSLCTSSSERDGKRERDRERERGSGEEREKERDCYIKWFYLLKVGGIPLFIRLNDSHDSDCSLHT